MTAIEGVVIRLQVLWLDEVWRRIGELRLYPHGVPQPNSFNTAHVHPEPSTVRTHPLEYLRATVLVMRFRR